MRKKHGVVTNTCNDNSDQNNLKKGGRDIYKKLSEYEIFPKLPCFK
jgi:hypothetical protein